MTAHKLKKPLVILFSVVAAMIGVLMVIGPFQAQVRIDQKMAQ